MARLVTSESPCRLTPSGTGANARPIHSIRQRALWASVGRWSPIRKEREAFLTSSRLRHARSTTLEVTQTVCGPALANAEHLAQISRSLPSGSLAWITFDQPIDLDDALRAEYRSGGANSSEFPRQTGFAKRLLGAVDENPLTAPVRHEQAVSSFSVAAFATGPLGHRRSRR
jgi:hypothetical protein